MKFVNALSSSRATSPLLHASHYPPVPSGPATYQALCGRKVAAVTAVSWSAFGPGRRCAECVNETIRRRSYPEAVS